MSYSPLSRSTALSSSEAAARWALRLDDGPLNPGEERAFADWLDADADHARALDDANWALVAPLRYAAAPEMMAIRNAALVARPPLRRRAWIATGIAGGLAASLAAIALLLPPGDAIWDNGPARVVANAPDPAHATYTTAIGERSTIALPDGSTVTLDTDSKIRLAFTGGARGIHLLRGQALFEVAKAKAPFVVHARGRQIVAVGTVFNVRLDGDRVKVALVEGVVRVETAVKARPGAPLAHRELVMTAGEVLDSAPAQQIVARSETDKVTSWKSGLLVFNDTPLSEAVAEINRYTTHPIAIADASVGSFRVSGVFRSNDPQRFSRAMSDILPVTSTVSPDGGLTLREAKTR